MFYSISRWAIKGGFRNLFPDFYGVTYVPNPEGKKWEGVYHSVTLSLIELPGHRLNSQCQGNTGTSMAKLPGLHWTNCWPLPSHMGTTLPVLYITQLCFEDRMRIRYMKVFCNLLKHYINRSQIILFLNIPTVCTAGKQMEENKTDLWCTREDAQRSRFRTPSGSLAISHPVNMHCCCKGETLGGPEQSFMACLRN